MAPFAVCACVICLAFCVCVCVIALQWLDGKVGEGSYTKLSFTLPCTVAPADAVPGVDRASSNSSSLKLSNSGARMALSWSGTQPRASLSATPAAHGAAAEAGEAGEEEGATLQEMEGTMGTGSGSSASCSGEGAPLGCDVLIEDDNNVNQGADAHADGNRVHLLPLPSLSLSLLFILLYFSIVICILL